MRRKTTHHHFLLILTVVTLSLLVPSNTRAGQSPARPNIILVFIDDMGWADFSYFGNKDAQTPNVDRMAAEGIAFEQFYVNAPICSPSRVAISTGTYPQRWRVTSYLARRELNRDRGMAQWLDPSAPMLARSLKQAGYATGHFGKWHIGGQRDVTDAPPISAYGFDESLTNFEGLGPKLLPLTLKPDGVLGRVWEGAEILGGPVVWMQRSEITSGFVNSAIAFIRRAELAYKPFYINLWPDDVHTPLWPPVDKWGDGSKRQLYLGVLEAMDRQLGQLFDYVRNSKTLRDNTLILICSDNGPERGAGQAGPLRGYKGQLFEGGIRSSLVVWGPGIMPTEAVGTRNRDSAFAAMDLVPSLLRLTGTTGLSQAQYDGEDLLDTLLGKSQASRQAPIYFSRPPGVAKKLPDLAVRHGQWKLLCDYDGARTQLYDVIADLGESRDQADTRPEVVRELKNKLLAWYRSMPLQD